MFLKNYPAAVCSSVSKNFIFQINWPEEYSNCDVGFTNSLHAQAVFLIFEVV